MDDPRDIEALLNKFHPLIAGFFRKRLSALAEAEDCSQEAVLEILGSLKKFQGRSSLSTWVYRICQYVFYNYLRRKNTGQQLQDRLKLERPAAPTGQKDDLDLLHSIINRLPQAMQRLYRFYYIDRLNIREIGRVLKCPEGSVKFLLHELRSRIKELLA